MTKGAEEIELFRREAILRAITGTAADTRGATPREIAARAAEIAQAAIDVVRGGAGQRP